MKLVGKTEGEEVASISTRLEIRHKAWIDYSLSESLRYSVAIVRGGCQGECRSRQS